MSELQPSRDRKSLTFFVGQLIWLLSLPVAAFVSARFAGNCPGVHGVWLPAGLGFWGLWQYGWRCWPTMLIGLLLAAACQSISWGVGFFQAVVETGAWVLCVRVLRQWIGCQPAWDRLQATFLWIVTALFACPLVIGVTKGIVLWWSNSGLSGHVAELCVVQVLAHVAGVTLLAPVGLAWWPWRKVNVTTGRWLESVGLLLAIGVFWRWTFGPESESQRLPIPDIALVIPLYAWSMVRFGRRGISLTMFVLGLVSVWAATHQMGPFVRPGGNVLSWSVMLASGNLCVLHITILLMSALWFERSQSERDVLKADARYRILFEQSPDAAFVVDLATSELLEFNDRLPQLLQCTAADLKQSSRFDFEVEPLSLAERSSIWSAVHPKTVEVDTKYRCPNGKIVDVRLTHSVVDYFGRKSLLMTARDVTARLADEQRLRDSEEKFRSLAKHIPALVVIQQGDSTNYINPAAEELTGFSAKELTGQNLLNWIRPEYRPQVQMDLQTKLRERQMVRREVDLVMKSGRMRHIDLSLVPMTQGGHLSWLACAVDMTDQREAESEIRQLNAELFHAARLRLLGEMAAGIIHEVKHPLSVISDLTDTAIKTVNDHQSLDVNFLSRTLASIQTSANDGLSSVQRLQDLSRRHEMSRKRIPILPVISDAARLIKLHSEWSDVSITWAIEGHLPRVFADRAAITQVLLDLFRNAMEAMRETPDNERRISLRVWSPEPEFVQISVSDCGCGVPDEFLKCLFKPFNTTKSDGMGLGLSLCESVIDQHDGKLWYEPASPRGATFHILLPVKNGAESPDS